MLKNYKNLKIDSIDREIHAYVKEHGPNVRMFEIGKKLKIHKVTLLYKLRRMAGADYIDLDHVSHTVTLVSIGKNKL